MRVLPENCEISGEALEVVQGVLPENKRLWRCGAKTRAGHPCGRSRTPGRERCQLHGGASTGPRTLKGRRRVGAATRQRYIKNAVADGWVMLEDLEREGVRRVLKHLHNSRNGTSKALGITVHGLRRILDGLPSRPEEAERLRDLLTQV